MAGGRARQAAFLLVVLVGAGVVWLLEQGAPHAASSADGYRQFEGCTLEIHRNNDGDSFHVRLGPDRVEELRLYFVDAPESAVKRYRDGNTNEERLAYQAEYFGGLSQAATVEAGRLASDWTRRTLQAAQPFTVLTRGEEVYGGPRLYALLRLEWEGEERWLHELLVEQGLARIYTQGTDLPDGTSRSAQERRLRAMERRARAGRAGAWGLANGRKSS